MPTNADLDCYDAGLLGGDQTWTVEQWHDAIRYYLSNAHDFYVSQAAAAEAPQPAGDDGVEWPTEPGTEWQYFHEGEWWECFYRCSDERDCNGDYILIDVSDGTRCFRYADALNGRGSGHFNYRGEGVECKWRRRIAPDGEGEKQVCPSCGCRRLTSAAKDIEAWFDRDALTSQVAALTKERDEARAAEQGLYDKCKSLSAHGTTCACALDRPDDVCAHHSPQLTRALAQLAAAQQRADAAEGILGMWLKHADAAVEALEYRYDMTPEIYESGLLHQTKRAVQDAEVATRKFLAPPAETPDVPRPPMLLAKRYSNEKFDWWKRSKIANTSRAKWVSVVEGWAATAFVEVNRDLSDASALALYDADRSENGETP